MKQHHTKCKGDLGVLKAQADIAEQGYLVLSPHTEHSPFDLVAYKNGQFIRVQVKYVSMKHGAVSVKFKSVWSDRHGVHSVAVDKSEIDYYCVYCPETNNCYYFDPKLYKEGVTLRIERSRNKQSKGVNDAELFRKLP